MLLQLNINNFALIEHLSLNFEQGFNILSGETGSGKSILIDAVNYVLGGKFNRDFIRTGETKTFVEAIFAIKNSKTEEVLKELEIDYEDLVIISRESFQSGKSVVKVNGKSLMIAKLKSISETLLDIHGQHENQNLLDSSNHINYLDYYGIDKIKYIRLKYDEEYNKYLEINNKIDRCKGNKDREKLSSYLKYQIDDIEEGKLIPLEEEELEEKFNILTHAEKISFALNNSYRLLYDTRDENSSIYDSLNTVIKDIKSVENHVEKVKNLGETIENIYFTLQEVIGDIRDLRDSIIYDEDELERINRRIYIIGSYKKKYGKNSITELLQYKRELEDQYEELVNGEEIIRKLEEEKRIIEDNLRNIGLELHKERKEFSNILKENIANELKYIGLEKSNFVINVELEEEIRSNGCSKVQFLISTNPGEPIKPLEKVVSGGELSRIMLALKTVFVDKDSIPTVIFDEIDTGISGRIAQAVAEKMYVISTKHQVFCVTHLPQIASISDNHYLVSKEVIDNKTFTRVEKLCDKEKIVEVAKMIGGVEVTKVTLENSKELIDMAEKKKSGLRS
ncbi:DNA repair protein RecN [Clostridium hydrogeniformans]|uniref:DNA repair protein RecN n=1 Tax=Clostridium hydrogeniformans TaxID=349933 RepID=UPI000482E752|nr:DNA repair protein RecN [Clostridium hydrogeniformans]